MPFIVSPGQLASRAEFYHQSGSLTEAGFGLLQVFEQLERHPPKPSMRVPSGQLAAGLREGWTPSEAFRRCGQFAPAFDIALIEAGEQSGRLDQVFKLLAQHYGDRAQLVRQTIGQLAYPVFIAHIAILIFPIGHLTGLLSPGGGTRFLLQKFAVLAPVYALVIAAVFACQGARGERWRALMERVLRAVPILGKARRHLALSRFAAALEALLNAGVGVLQAFELAAAASGSPALRADVVALLPHIDGGLTPAEAMRASTEFPETFTNLYTSGEVSGKLDDTLRRLHLHYLEEGTRQLGTFATWAGHSVHLGIMLAIAWQVVGFYVGYFNQINDVMK